MLLPACLNRRIRESSRNFVPPSISQYVVGRLCCHREMEHAKPLSGRHECSTVMWQGAGWGVARESGEKIDCGEESQKYTNVATVE